MKKNGIILVIFLVLSVMLAFIVRNTFFEETTIQNHTTMELLEKQTVIMENIIRKEDFSETEWTEFIESECEAIADCEYLLKVSPTGNLYFNNSVIMQEVLVDSVLKGQCAEEKIWICSQGSTISDNKDGTYRLCGLDYSLMQPKYQYLVCCIPSEINAYSKQKVYDIDENVWFSYYNLSKNSEKVMEHTFYDSEIEFYTDSKEVLGYLNQLKMEIFERIINNAPL